MNYKSTGKSPNFTPKSRIRDYSSQNQNIEQALISPAHRQGENFAAIEVSPLTGEIHPNELSN